MHLTSSGDLHLTGEVGIGTDNPTVPLEVRSSNNTLGILSSTDSGANLDLFDDDTQSRIRTVDGSLHLYSDFKNEVSDSVIRFFVDGANEKLRINSVGQISIRGTTTAFDTTGDLDSLQLYYETDSGQASIGPYSSGGNTHLSFYTNAGGAAAVERLRIASDGKVDVTGGYIARNPTDSFTLNGVNQPHYGFNLNASSTVPVGLSLIHI